MTRYIVGKWGSYTWEIPFSLLFSYLGGYYISHPQNVDLLTYYTVFLNFKSLFLFLGPYILLFSSTVIFNSFVNLRRQLKFYEKLYQSIGLLIATAIEKCCSSDIVKGDVRKGNPLLIQDLRIRGGNSVGLVNLAEVILKKSDKMLTEDEREHLRDLDGSRRTVAFSSIQPAFWVHPSLFTYLISNGVKCAGMYGEQIFDKTFYENLLRSLISDGSKDDSYSFIRFFIYDKDIYKLDPYFKVISDFHDRFKIPYLRVLKGSLIEYVLVDNDLVNEIKEILGWQEKIYNEIHREKIPESYLNPKHWNKLPFFLDFIKFDIAKRGSCMWYQNDRKVVDEDSSQALCIKAVVSLIIAHWDEMILPT